MAERLSTVVLMCGLPGAGKTTYAKELERRGYVRLSIDEVVWQRIGQRDAGRVLEPAAFDRLKDQIRDEQRLELVELMTTGRDVVVDRAHHHPISDAANRCGHRRAGVRVAAAENRLLPGIVRTAARRQSASAKRPVSGSLVQVVSDVTSANSLLS
ncbi:AAA family ATPase [Kitasatospora sp. NPDC001159]